MQSTSYQAALRVHGASAAYKRAVAELLTNEARWIAPRLGVYEDFSISDTQISPPQYGLTGSPSSANYYVDFSQGVFQSIKWCDWLRKVKPPLTDMLEFANRPCLLNKDSALQLARTWLTNIGVNATALETKSTVFQAPAAALRNTPPGQPQPMQPRFIIKWPGHGITVDILATTKQLIELTIGNPLILIRPRLELKDAATLLGPDPTPAELMARIISPEVYNTIAEPDSIQAWLLTSSPYPRQKKDRLGPALLDPAMVKKFTEALLDVESYNGFDIQKGCIPDDGARLLIKRGAEELHISFCFECDILSYSNKTVQNGLNFDRGHNRFADLLQELFPNDAVLQSIPRRQKS